MFMLNVEFCFGCYKKKEETNVWDFYHIPSFSFIVFVLKA